MLFFRLEVSAVAGVVMNQGYFSGAAHCQSDFSRQIGL
jgi:hypothetical protein